MSGITFNSPSLIDDGVGSLTTDPLVQETLGARRGKPVRAEVNRLRSAFMRRIEPFITVDNALRSRINLLLTPVATQSLTTGKFETRGGTMSAEAYVETVALVAVRELRNRGIARPTPVQLEEVLAGFCELPMPPFCRS